jgi:spermidine/putrescine transport system permease protein
MQNAQPMKTTPAGMSIVRRVFGGWTVAVLTFLYLPILLLVIYSFNKSDLNIVWTGATTRWYVALFHDQNIISSLKNSVFLATVVTILSVFLGTAGAWLAYRYRFPLGKSVWSMIYLPIVMPDVIMGISLLVLFATVFNFANAWFVNHESTARFQLGWTTLILSHVTFCFPFVMVAVQSRLNGLDPSLEEAAMDLGATPSRAFVLVVLPYLFPAVISGALMSFTLSMDELIVSSFTHGPESVTLPLVIFGMARVKLEPTLNAVSTIFIVGTAISMGIAEYLPRLGKPVRTSAD